MLTLHFNVTLAMQVQTSVAEETLSCKSRRNSVEICLQPMHEVQQGRTSQ